MGTEWTSVYSPKGKLYAQPAQQLIVPREYREKILEMAHNNPRSGHQGF